MTIRSTLGAGFLTVAVLGVIALTPFTASAELITFTHSGASGSGSIGGIPFSDQAFTITATGDTLNRQSFNFGGIVGFSIDHAAASIMIDNVGTFDFVTPTRTFVNNTFDVVGFARAGIDGLDLYDGPFNAAFGGWDMLSSIGPISGDIRFFQWTESPVITSGGQLIFDDGATTGSFQAVVGAVPEPSTLTLFSIAGVLVATVHAVRRRRQG
jgi:hypothetical protein